MPGEVDEVADELEPQRCPDPEAIRACLARGSGRLGDHGAQISPMPLAPIGLTCEPAARPMPFVPFIAPRKLQRTCQQDLRSLRGAYAVDGISCNRERRAGAHTV